MKKLTFSLLSILGLMLIVMVVFAFTSENPEAEKQQNQKAETTAKHYEMPKVLPASWVIGH
jgi:uncharacterized alpha/beta hydrolase family protein